MSLFVMFVLFINYINLIWLFINVIDINGEKDENQVSNEIWDKVNEVNKIGKFHHLN